MDGVPVEESPVGLRAEQLSKVNALTIAVLAKVGRLPPGAAANVWAGQAPSRWPVGEIATGLAVWALGGIGLWGLAA